MDIQVKMEVEQNQGEDLTQSMIKQEDFTSDYEAYLEGWSVNTTGHTDQHACSTSRKGTEKHVIKLEDVMEDAVKTEIETVAIKTESEEEIVQVKLEDNIQDIKTEEDNVVIKTEVEEPTENSCSNQNKFPGYCSVLNADNTSQLTTPSDDHLVTQMFPGATMDESSSSATSDSDTEADSLKQPKSFYWPNKPKVNGYFAIQNELFGQPTVKRTYKKTWGPAVVPYKARDDEVKRKRFERLWRKTNKRYLPPSDDADQANSEQKVEPKHAAWIESGCIDKHVLNACTEEDRYTCYICGSVANKMANLITHIRTFHVEKVHQCDVCKKAFSQACHLEAHMQVHKKKYQRNKQKKSQTCGEDTTLPESSSSKTNRYEHPYVCGVCDSDFAAVINLQSHMSTHALKKLYVCPICGDSFVQRSKRHLSMHRPPFKCVVCTREYKNLGAIQQHFHTHSNDNWYKCGICENKFRSSFQLNGHIRKKHNHTNA